MVLSWELYSRRPTGESPAGWRALCPCPSCRTVSEVTEADLRFYNYRVPAGVGSWDQQGWFECPKCQAAVILHLRIPESALLASPKIDPGNNRVDLSAEMVNRFREGRSDWAGQ